MTAYDTVVNLVSTTGVSIPTPPVGPVTYLLCENELMTVSIFSGTSGAPVGVARGQNGTKAIAHNSSAPVYVFAAGDYGSLYSLGTEQILFKSAISQIIGAPMTGATIAPAIFGPDTAMHFTGTTALVTITLPSGVLATQITLIFDGSASGLTWTAAGNISVAGTATTAKSAVTFFYDPSTSKWIPSRLA
jgi:hypothetical protein